MPTLTPELVERLRRGEDLPQPAYNPQAEKTAARPGDARCGYKYKHSPKHEWIHCLKSADHDGPHDFGTTLEPARTHPAICGIQYAGNPVTTCICDAGHSGPHLGGGFSWGP